MKRFLISSITALASWIGISTAALAQSSCPSIATGAVLTAAQWNACFAAKQNTLGYQPVNRAGDTMLGRLTTAASQSSGSGFNLPQGSPPTSPQNGDLWTTLTGVYARINGATVGPFGAISASSFAATAPLSVTFPTQVVTYALNYDSSLTLSGSNLSVATAPAGALTGTILAANVVNSSLTSVGALAAGSLTTGFTPITNALLANSMTTVNGQACTLGSTCTITASATTITVGTTAVAGGTTGRVLYDNGGTLGELTVTGSGSAVLATSPSIASPTFTGTVAGANTIPLSILAQSGANTMLGNWTGSAANVSANAMPSCADSGGAHLNYVNGTGITCGTTTGAAAAGTLTGTTLAANVVSSSLTSVGTLTGGSTGAGFTVALATSTITGALPGANFPALTGDVTTAGGALATTIANNAVTNAKSAQMAAVTLKGNPTNALANASDFTLASLTQSLTPDTTNDMLLIWDSVSGTLKKINPTTIASASVAGVASIDAKTGAFTTSTGVTTVVNDIQLAAIADDSLLMNATGGSAAPTAVALTNCATARTYDTSTHTFGCRTATGTGNMVQATSPTLVTPVLGAATATSINGLTITSTTGTLTVASGKTLTANNSITLAGTDSTTMTFPSTSATLTQTIASGAKALATGAISSGTCTTAQTDTATGALTSDAVGANFSADPTAVTGYMPSTNGMLAIIPWVTTNTINFKVCNNTSASITPGAVTVNWRITR